MACCKAYAAVDVDNFETGDFATEATLEGDPEWTITDASPISGSYSAKAPLHFIYNFTDSILRYELTSSEAGVLSFDLRGPIRKNGFLEVRVNGDAYHTLTETDESVQSLEVILPAGTNTLTFAAYQSGSYYDSALGDFAPFELWLDNLHFEEGAPPVARLAPIFYGGADSSGNGSITLDASASFDVGGTIHQYAWSWDGGGASGATAEATFPAGATTVQLTLTDNDGDITTVETTVSIIPQGEFTDSFESESLDPLRWSTSAEEAGYEWMVADSGDDAVVSDGSFAAFSSLRYRDGVYQSRMDLYVNHEAGSELWFDLGIYMYSPDVPTNNLTVEIDDVEWAHWPESDVSYNYNFEQSDIRIPLTSGFHKISWIHNNSDGTSSRAAQEISIDHIRQTSGIKPSIVFELEEAYFDEDGDGTVALVLDGTGTTDFDGSIVSHQWTVDSAVHNSQSVNLELAIGRHTITYRATDDEQFTTEATWEVTVYPENLNDGFETGDLSGAVWEASGAGEWEVVAGAGIDGSFALQAPVGLGAGEKALITLEVNFPDSSSSVTFAAKQLLDSDNVVRVLENGSVEKTIPATGEWFFDLVSVNRGVTEVTFEYTHGTGSSDSPGLLIDLIREPTHTPPFVEVPQFAFAGDLDGNGTETVLLDGSGSSSNVTGGTKELTYLWSWAGGETEGAVTWGSLPVGEIPVTLTVTDENGNSRSGWFTATVGAYGVPTDFLTVFSHPDLSDFFAAGWEQGTDYIYATSGRRAFLEFESGKEGAIKLVTSADPNAFSQVIFVYVDGVEVEPFQSEHIDGLYQIYYPSPGNSARIGIALGSGRRLYSVEVDDGAGYSFALEPLFPDSGEVTGAGFHSIFDTNPVTVEVITAVDHDFIEWIETSDSFWKNYDTDSPGPFSIVPSENLSGKAVILPNRETVAAALDLPVEQASYDGLYGLSSEAREGDTSLLVESISISDQNNPGHRLLFWTKAVTPEAQGDGFVIAENWTRNLDYSHSSAPIEPEPIFDNDHVRFLLDSVQFLDDLVTIFFSEDYIQGNQQHPAGVSAHFDSTRSGALGGPEFDYIDGRGAFQFADVAALQSSFVDGDYTFADYSIPLPTGAFPASIETPEIDGAYNLYSPQTGHPDDVTWQRWENPVEGGMIRVLIRDTDGNKLTDVMLSTNSVKYPLPDEDCRIGVSFLNPVDLISAQENSIDPGIMVETYVGKTTYIKSMARPSTFDEWTEKHGLEEVDPSDYPTDIAGDLTIGQKYRYGLAPDQVLALSAQVEQPSAFADNEFVLSFEISEEVIGWRLERSEDLDRWETRRESGPDYGALHFEDMGDHLLFEEVLFSTYEPATAFYRMTPLTSFGQPQALIESSVYSGETVTLQFDQLSEELLQRSLFLIGDTLAPVFSYDLENNQVSIQAINTPGTYSLSYIDELGSHSTHLEIELLESPEPADSDARISVFTDRIDNLIGTLNKI